MKNILWIARDSAGYCSTSEFQLIIENGIVRHKNYPDDYTRTPKRLVNEDFLDFLGVNIEKYDVCQIIYDTKTPVLEVKRNRKRAWYLTRELDAEIPSAVVARYWNGECFKVTKNSTAWKEDDLTIDETPITSLLLKELE